MPHPKVQTQESTMIDKNQLDSKMGAQTLTIQEEARERQEDVKKR